MKKNSKKLISVDCGHLGEDIVITELTRNNYIATRLDDRAKLFDIIAMNKNGTRFCAIQVKTNQIGSNRFTLSQKNEDYCEEQTHCFYAFVKLKSDKNSEDEIYFVPFKEVAKSIAEEHKKYLKSTSKNGAEHKDTPIRTFILDENEHQKYNFSILNLDKY